MNQALKFTRKDWLACAVMSAAILSGVLALVACFALVPTI